MLFSSISFLYYFLPVVLGLYFLVPKPLKNAVLLVASLVFYFCGEPIYVILIVASSVMGYLHGLWIVRARGSRYAKLPLVSSLVVSLGVLMFFKYADFFIENLNAIFAMNLSPLKLGLPIGISFYTFQILSYTIDVYRGNATVQKNIVSFTTYVTLFPQLIAGPIVRYTTIEAELTKRSHSFEKIAYGIRRFLIGLSKKVIIANSLGELGNIVSKAEENTIVFYWVAAIAYMLQIYFDFSAYSDMAIGLGRMFGFHFLENFNYPFIAKSITEFWRRWHMSLGTWFRDYVYIPMGGNQVGPWKWIRNIVVVWFLTGFWHGAEWNFIVWGLFFAFFLVLEKAFLKERLAKLPAIIGHGYTLFLINISFVIFQGEGLFESVEHLKGMFGLTNAPLLNAETIYYVKSYAVVLLIAVLGATPLVARGLNKAAKSNCTKKLITMVEPVVLLALLLLCTAYLVDGSFNPFLYFRF